MENETQVTQTEKMVFCKYCGEKIPEKAVICTHCGMQVAEIKQQQTQNPSIVINNSNANVNSNTNVNNNGVGFVPGRRKNKWVALILCLSMGFFGAHKFYEGKAGMGILYMFTGGLCMIGVVVDAIALLSKPNPYYV